MQIAANPVDAPDVAASASNGQSLQIIERFKQSINIHPPLTLTFKVIMDGCGSLAGRGCSTSYN
jgi:hypothetical protein